MVWFLWFVAGTNYYGVVLLSAELLNSSQNICQANPVEGEVPRTEKIEETECSLHQCRWLAKILHVFDKLLVFDVNNYMPSFHIFIHNFFVCVETFIPYINEAIHGTSFTPLPSPIEIESIHFHSAKSGFVQLRHATPFWIQ